MSDRDASVIDRARAARARSRDIAGIIARTATAIAETLEGMAAANSARAADLQQKAARARRFAEICMVQVGVNG